MDACIPLEALNSPVFITTLLVKKSCAGGTIATTQELEALRYCETINGRLTITVNDASADFTSLRYISQIQGMPACLDLSHA